MGNPRAECIWPLDSRGQLAQVVAQKPNLCNHGRTMDPGGSPLTKGGPLFIACLACLACAHSERSRPTQRRDSIREVWLHTMDRRVACPQRGLPKNHDSGPRSPRESCATGQATREGEAQSVVTLAPGQGVPQGESRRGGR